MPVDSNQQPGPSWLVPVTVVVIAAVLIVVIVMMTGTSESSGGSSELGAQTATEEFEKSDFSDAASRDGDDLLAVGPEDAPVVLVMFSDYQCPYCATWTDETLPAMMEHVKTGDLRIEWRDVNVYGPASERSARAAYAAALQGSFMEYNEALFADGRTRTEANLSEEKLVTLANDIGLDAEKFATDLNSEEAADLIAENEDFSIDLGVTATPVFVIGGEPIVGAQSTKQFEAAFQMALDESK